MFHLWQVAILSAACDRYQMYDNKFEIRNKMWILPHEKRLKRTVCTLSISGPSAQNIGLR